MKLTLLASLLCTGALAQTAVAATNIDELYELLKEQQREIEALKKEQKETEAKVEATADAIDSGNMGGNKRNDWANNTTIGGYGEHHYNNFDEGNDQVDAHRFVLYFGHQYSDTVSFFSELEVEHGLVEGGDDSPGELELEQAFVQWDFAEKHSLVAGQFLVPVGIINETHEPDTFYGTERNRVESNIIPSTWWETGAMLKGELAPGFSYNLALHSGLNTEEGNIRSGRQKSAKAVANDYAYTARLKYTGVPGLELATSLQYQEDISQGDAEEASATLTELHAAYQVAAFQLRALWAAWRVDGDVAEALGRDDQEGYYIEPSYKVTPKLGFFARYSEWDNTAGLDLSEASEVVDYGLNYWLVPNVVFKADFSDVQNDDGNDSFNLGLGWSF